MIKRLIYAVGLLLINGFLASVYQEYAQLSSKDFASFLSMCGTFIQTGFQSNKPGTWDYFLVILSVQVVLFTSYYSLKYLIVEKEPTDHIKHKILE